MDDIESILSNYYKDYDEDGRLERDNAHRIEYITTLKYIDKYLNKGDRILEVGAGTGRYSIKFAEDGFQVDAVELVDSNLEILKSKIKSNMRINAIKGNCLDLKMYDDNVFDITLVLGPLYHLYNEKDIFKAIQEAVRVTKRNGKIIMAYIPDDAAIISYGLRKGNLKRMLTLVDEKWNVKNIEEEVFATYKFEEMQEIVSRLDIKVIEEVAADGIAPQLQDYINKLDNEEFEIYLDYHLKNCMRKDLIGYSSHILKILEKA